MKLETRPSRGAATSIRSLALTVTMLVAAVWLAGCAATEVDEKRAREAILYDVEQKTGVEIRSVECPSGVEVVPGAVFECRVRAADGRVALARMKILNADADVRFVGLEPVAGQEISG